MAARQWLRMHDPDFSPDGIFKYVPRLDKWISVFGHDVDNS
jgi:hypothetical protein